MGIPLLAAIIARHSNPASAWVSFSTDDPKLSSVDFCRFTIGNVKIVGIQVRKHHNQTDFN
jgi:hypothetical protein